MRIHGHLPYVALLLSLVLHALVLGSVARYTAKATDRPAPAQPRDKMLFLQVTRAPPVVEPPPPPPSARHQAPAVTPSTQRALATQDAPPAPTAQEWAFAAKYTLKNSKGYRYSWGQQVRSMMGTAVEGPDQGLVRFRVEIGPDGRLVRLETLWSTSRAAEQRARQAVEHMPPLPPPPTGKPLVFEKTIVFTPFQTEHPPIYKNDCLPDPPGFRNRFAWNGQGQPDDNASPAEEEPQDLMTQEDCLRQLPQDSIEAEAANDQRQLEQWRSMKLGR